MLRNPLSLAAPMIALLLTFARPAAGGGDTDQGDLSASVSLDELPGREE